ncbi:MAG TPA: DUF4255 domain-containing protein [Thermoanaerobaculia bacterium]|nr:DUF4255 domain-containing protein [Thermoanaerobaculia bacterium]
MLDVALKFLVKELGSYLLLRTGVSFGEPDLCRIVDDSGKWAVPEDRIGASLINIEEERAVKSQLPEATYVNGRNVVLQPALNLNLHVLFAANFKRYDEALRYLSYVLTYFQSHLLFTPTQYPGLDPRIGKLSAELQSLTYEQVNQIWAFLGGKQLPSALYKVRMLTLQDAGQTIEAPVAQLTPVLHQ